jgi:hypothetical protein
LSPFQNTLLFAALSAFAVVPPFLLGRWSAPRKPCGACDSRIRGAADRARANGEAVARLRVPRPDPGMPLRHGPARPATTQQWGDV